MSHAEKPKDEKDLEERKANEKAGQIQNMDEHKIPMEELIYRFGTSWEMICLLNAFTPFNFSTATLHPKFPQ